MCLHEKLEPDAPCPWRSLLSSKSNSAGSVITTSRYRQEVLWSEPKNTIPEWDCKWEWDSVQTAVSQVSMKQCALLNHVCSGSFICKA